jgi:two-component sensor histidine kinase
MNGNRRARRWRTFVIKIAALSLVWLLLATMFSLQFYWIGKDLPVKISWWESFLRALVEWGPWMILSPIIVWLAERCRFDRARRFWGVLPHLPACLLMALAYQGISMFLTQRSGSAVFFNVQNNGAMISFVSDAPLRMFGSQPDPSPGGHPPPGAFLKSVNIGGSARMEREAGFDQGLQSFSAPVTSLTSKPGSRGPLQITSVQGPFDGEPPPLPLPKIGPWTRFFHLAATRAQSTIPIYWAIVCVTWVISSYQQLRERERRTLELEARLMQSNLQALKTQLQPHFLFNTLNAIASLVRRKPDAAEDMIGSLSDFLRMTLDTAQEHEVPLRREIEFLDLYLEIQQARFGERLRIQKEIEPDTLDASVPALILQPLVENSVRHGIEPRETGGTIFIRARREGTSLQFEIRDDGEGLKAGQLVALREGVGLSNTKARLQELYGEAHRFKITLNAEGGLTVTVEVPWRAVTENARHSASNAQQSELDVERCVLMETRGATSRP